ncbi:MAG: hypothetical protein WCZ18_11320, partial [Ottowia sp.]
MTDDFALAGLDESRLWRLMKVWRQAFSVQREPTTPNAQRSTLNAQRSTLNAQRSTLNLPIMAAQPQSLQPRSGALIRH